jgi:hypothetical protein
MDETTEAPKKRRGWPKGKPRKKAPVAAPTFTSAPEPEAPINVFVRLKNGMTSSFGCARRTVENGFHVFFYPSETDRYRETRREFAVSEIVEIEITEARQFYNFVTPAQTVLKETAPIVNNAVGPKIHSARQSAAGIIGALENSSGPIKMDNLPNLSFGDSEA